MQRSVTLRGRTQLAALLDTMEQEADQGPQRVAVDGRNRRSWRQLVLGVLVARSTRLVEVARVVAPQRRARSVKAVAQGLSYFLREAKVAVPAWSARQMAAALHQLDPAHLVTYEGKVLVVLDPTEYAKRSRGRGKAGRQMQYIGRVRRSTRGTKTLAPKKRPQGTPSTPARTTAPARVATTYGYVDVWVGLALQGKQFLPLARQLFSSAHPHVSSQNQVEEAVLAQALALVHEAGRDAIVLGDRGIGRKELIVRLAQQQQDFVLRLDPDVLLSVDDAPARPLAEVLAEQPWRGEVLWDRGQAGRLPCRLRTVRGTLHFSRSGRKADVQAAVVNIVALVPLDGTTDPLVLVTTLPITTRAQARAVARLYSSRWAVETAFETMHAWGQERFMVRSWEAIDRLLWVLAVACALLVLALHTLRLRAVRRQAVALLKQQSVLGTHLTVGKLAEAIRLDYAHHTRAWTSGWRL